MHKIRIVYDWKLSFFYFYNFILSYRLKVYVSFVFEFELYLPPVAIISISNKCLYFIFISLSPLNFPLWFSLFDRNKQSEFLAKLNMCFASSKRFGLRLRFSLGSRGFKYRWRVVFFQNWPFPNNFCSDRELMANLVKNNAAPIRKKCFTVKILVLFQIVHFIVLVSLYALALFRLKVDHIDVRKLVTKNHFLEGISLYSWIQRADQRRQHQNKTRWYRKLKSEPMDDTFWT